MTLIVTYNHLTFQLLLIVVHSVWNIHCISYVEVITVLFLTFMKSANYTKQVGSDGENL